MFAVLFSSFSFSRTLLGPPSSALLPFFWGEGSSTKKITGKRWHPYSTLSNLEDVAYRATLHVLPRLADFRFRRAGRSCLCILPRDLIGLLAFLPTNGFSVLNHQKLVTFCRASQISQPLHRSW